jgi:Chaperone of endosialidase
MSVPYSFATQTGSIPLSQLDSNFSTAITLGNTAVVLGNTYSTLGNLTLSNVTISSGNVSINVSNVSTINTVTLTVTGNETVGGNVTITGNVSVNVANVTTLNATSSTITGNETVGGNVTVTGNVTANVITAKILTSPSATNLTLQSAGITAVTVDTSQNVGIGTSSPSGILHTYATNGVNYFESPGVSGVSLQFRTNSTNRARIGIPSAVNALAFWTDAGTTEAMRIDSSGNVGIGATSITANTRLLVSGGRTNLVANSDAYALGVGYSSAGAYYLGANSSNNALIFSNSGGTEVARFDASGNVGLSVTPSSWSGVGNIQGINGFVWSSYDASLGAGYYYNSGYKYIGTTAPSLYAPYGGVHKWLIAPSGTAGNTITFTQAMTLDNSGNLVVGATSALGGGKVSLTVDLSSGNGFVANNSTASYGGTNLFFRATNSSSASVGGLTHTASQDMGVWGYSNLILSTGSSGTERARIDSSGNLLVGTTTRSVDLVTFASAGGTVNQLGIRSTDDSSGNTFIIFRNSAGTGIGSITRVTTTNAVAYNTTSDQRLKENIADAESASNLIDEIQVRQFDWKTDGSHQRYGFIAQELVTVAPEAVHQPKDPKEMMAVDYSKLVPMLVKEIQSLRARLKAANIV